MRLIGLKTAMLAAGLMLVGAGHAAPQTANSAATATTPSTTGAPAAPAVPVTSEVKPLGVNPAAAPTPAADPAMLARDGAPELAPTKGIGDAVDGDIGIQPQVTKNGERARGFHDHWLVPTIIVISVFVLLLLLWVIVRFNARANPVPSKTSHNTLIEVIWTLVPVLILVTLAIPSIGLLQAQFKPAPKDAITLKVTGNQWYWTYSYPDNGGFEITSNMLKEKDEVAPGERAREEADGPRLLAVDNRVVLPVGVPIRLITTSADVIHSWAIPAFWIKLDAVPGRLNETSFTIEKPGLYFGQCSELCGPKHGYMPIAVQAVPLDVYNRWVVAKGGTVAGAQPAAAVSDNAAVEATAGPAVNATVAAPTTNQAATANPAGAGNAGN
ncbi:MAG: cytochrome c oxidase subunit II [Proteobacteria bacterium]|nr:cytochrome c oxidase subunit II [Pseudomonadota bacterium]